jgi:hypothetical protein
MALSKNCCAGNGEIGIMSAHSIPLKHVTIRRIVMRRLSIVAFSVSVVLFCGCQKNVSVEEKVTIRGNVSYGAPDITTGLIKVVGAAGGADVSCAGFPESTKAGSDGNYTLSINTVRNFTAPNADTFLLNASWQGNSKTATVYAKPGDSVTASDIVISK